LAELPKPQAIFEFLDQYVIGQDRAKKSLSVAVYNHDDDAAAQTPEVLMLTRQRSIIL